MTSFLDTINTIEDIPAAGTLEPGRFWWLHGVKQAKTPGVFYAKATEFGDAPSAPWAPDDRFDNEQGYSAPELKIAVVGFRSQWFHGGVDGQPPQYLINYEQGAKKQIELLCLVEGVEDPMVFSVSGKNKAGPVQDILKFYRDGLLKQASRMAKRQLPLWSFWLPIANQKTPEGKTKYLEATDGNGKAYGSIVTPPALFLPENAMDVLFVGADTLRRGADVYNQYADWFKTQRLPAGVIEGEIVPPKALPAPAYTGMPEAQIPAPRNVPQPIGDDGEDIPF